MYKKKMLMEVPRRSSDRLALKALQKEEGERQEALEREKQREEQRKFEAEEAARKEEEAIRRRERQREEAIKRRRGKKFIGAESESACLLAHTHKGQWPFSAPGAANPVHIGFYMYTCTCIYLP